MATPLRAHVFPKAIRRSLARREQQLRLQSLTAYSFQDDFDDENNHDGRAVVHRIDEVIVIPKTNLPTQKTLETQTIAVAPSGKISTSKGIEKNEAIRLGDAVDANYNGEGLWYPAIVIAVSDDNKSFTVQYDEDFVVETLEAPLVVLAPPSAGAFQNSSAFGRHLLQPEWLAMLDWLCEYQKVKGYEVKKEELDLYNWWIETKENYIQRKQLRRSLLGNRHVALLEDVAGWSYEKGQVVFPSMAQNCTKRKQNMARLLVKSPESKRPRVAHNTGDVPTLITPEKLLRGRFPEIAHSMISQLANKTDLVEWSKDGRAFYVNVNGQSLQATIEKFFRHSHWRSVQKQFLNYGIYRQTDGKYAGAYYHPNFRRDSTPSEISQIKSVTF